MSPQCSNTTIEGPVPSDAGVAGTGVLLSFFFTAILALGLSLTIILSEFRNKTSSIRRRLLSSYSDQQILQGIGIHAVGLAKRDQMLPYHFFIIWCLGLLSQAVHNATLLSLVHDFRRDWVLRWLRQLLMFVNLGLSVVYGVFILRAVETGLADDPIPISCVWETNSGNGSSNRSGLSYFGTIAVMTANVLVFALASWYLHWRIQRFAKPVKLVGTLLMGALAAGAIGVHAIAHTSPPGLRFDEYVGGPKAIIERARRSTENLLSSAEAHAGATLKSVVLVSSLAAMMRLQDEPGYRYTGDEFYTEYIDLSLQAGDEAGLGLLYGAVKVAEEQAFWDHLGDPQRKSTFTGAVVSPSFVAGPILVRPAEPESMTPSMKTVWYIYAGAVWPDEFPMPTWVDVRDVARAIVFGVQKPEKAKGRRFLLAAYRVGRQAFADVLREKIPERKGVIREGTPGEGYPADFVTWGPEEVGMDGSRWTELSGQEYLPFEECAVGTAKSFDPYLAEGKEKGYKEEVPVLFQ
ncbi:hypothetical protein BN1708_014400 [Verticillium longisporum]|uniref:Uncharacterized protein n=1 Tax=Verticillium longisporum TaxID=100787 RepID=A0A0G4LW17_VERLO|nr:hypothetical protein BN1708_014400 [Verticillium longisporum]